MYLFFSWPNVESRQFCGEKGLDNHLSLMEKKNFKWVVLYLSWTTYTLSLDSSKFKNTSDTLFGILFWNPPLTNDISKWELPLKCSCLSLVSYTLFSGLVILEVCDMSLRILFRVNVHFKKVLYDFFQVFHIILREGYQELRYTTLFFSQSFSELS